MYICTSIYHRVLILMAAEIVPGGPSSRIGEPTDPFSASGSGAASGGGGGSSSSSSYGAVVPAEQHFQTQPVRSLNLYTNKWMIKVRVTKKGPLKSGNKNGRDWKLFSADLVDTDGTEIRSTFFGEAVDKYFDVVEKDRVFYMGNGKLGPANKRYTSITNDYEIKFDDRSVVQACADDGTVAGIQYSFVSIKSIETSEPGKTIDIIGVIKECNDRITITTRKGTELEKRDVTLVDDSGASITLTMFGKESHDDSVTAVGAVAAFKGVRIGDFGGRTLSTTMSSDIAVNPPNVARAAELSKWWVNGGSNAEIQELSGQRGGGAGPISMPEKRAFLGDIDSKSLGHGDRPDIITVKATVTRILRSEDRQPWYPACPNEVQVPGGASRKCNKKLVEDGAGEFSCLRPECSSMGAMQPTHRYILPVVLHDSTGSRSVTLFDDEAKLLLGMSASDLKQRLDSAGGMSADGGGGEPDGYRKVLDGPLFTEKFFTLRVRVESVNDELRTKVGVLRFKAVDPAYEASKLLEAIQKYDEGQ